MQQFDFNKYLQSNPLLKESIEEVRTNSFVDTGFQSGPNGIGRLDISTEEGKYVSDKANQLYALLNDKNLIDFAKGYVNSISAPSRVRYEGLETVAKMLLYIKNK